MSKASKFSEDVYQNMIGKTLTGTRNINRGTKTMKLNIDFKECIK